MVFLYMAPRKRKSRCGAQRRRHCNARACELILGITEELIYSAKHLGFYFDGSHH